MVIEETAAAVILSDVKHRPLRFCQFPGLIIALKHSWFRFRFRPKNFWGLDFMSGSVKMQAVTSVSNWKAVPGGQKEWPSSIVLLKKVLLQRAS